MNEISEGTTMPGRIRRSGAGRKKITASDPKLLDSLEYLIEPETRGDPESPLALDLQEHPHFGHGIDATEASGQS
jgi:hypothetical protein